MFSFRLKSPEETIVLYVLQTNFTYCFDKKLKIFLYLILSIVINKDKLFICAFLKHK